MSTPRAAVLMTADRLWESRQVIVLALRSADTVAPLPFEAGPRIPGAIDTYLATDFAAPSDPVEGTRPLPDIAALQLRARSWGIDQDSIVVVYDHDGGLQAARAWWVLRWAGVANCFLLDGGFQAWQRAGLPTTVTPPPGAGTGTIVLSPGHMAVLDAAAAADLARRGVLLDSRIAANYQGGQGDPRRGHIPGARNIPAPDVLQADGCFADAAALAAFYAEVGADGRVPVGVYCGAGVSAAHAVAALASIGIPAAMYPGSWSAWVSDPHRPVATGPEQG